MKKLIGIILLIVCVGMLLCGCGGSIRVKKIELCSVQNSEPIVINVTGNKVNNGMEKMGKADYTNNKSKDEMIKELVTKNKVNIFEIDEYEFLKFDGAEGIYNLRIYEEENFTRIVIDDMCGYFDSSELSASYEAVFPYFMLYSDDPDWFQNLNFGHISFEQKYYCDMEKTLAIAKELNLWEIVEYDDGFALKYGKNGVRIKACGENFVQLQIE